VFLLISFPNKKYKIVYANPAWDIKYVKEIKEGINPL